MNEVEKEIFKRIKSKVEKDSNILAMVIFGSYAREESYNDIDICLFLYPDRYSPELELNYRLEFSEKFDIKIFQKLPLYIQSRILNEGKIIIDKDYDILFDIYIDKIKEFNLFEPHFKTFLESVKNG